MATSLDLQEQEQLDALKAFWKQYGNLITWVMVLALGGIAAWNGWQIWQRDQGAKAAAMFEELDRSVTAGDADRAGRVFSDLKDRFGRTAYAQQGGLLAAKAQLAKQQTDAAKASLTWVAQNAIEEEYRTVAQLRLAGVLLDAKDYDGALKAIDAAKADGFQALAADRRGDVLIAQGKKDEARAAFQTAWAAMDDKLDYKRIVEAKLMTLGAAPAAAASAPTAGASK